MQYLQDYDEVYPLTDYTGKPTNGGNGLVTWTWEIQPYIKAWKINRDPDFPTDPWGAWDSTTKLSSASNDINGVVGVGWWEWMGSYAYNAGYLTPNFQCVNALPNAAEDYAGGYGAADNQLDAPASTVLAVDTKVTCQNGGWWAVMHFVSAPADDTAPDDCAEYIWGTDGSWDKTDYNAPSGTDRAALYHSGGTNVVFCDGHVKWLTPGSLAAGTNWTASSTGSQIQITDISQYLWSLKKSGTHDIE
jgi:prepilin-type processing-associated H-X9-DG protein